MSNEYYVIPMWAAFLITLIITQLTAEGSYQWAKHKGRSEKEKEAPVGSMVGAMLGLLAFILGFTFSMANDRYNDRKVALLNEANAIRSTYLQADLIPEPQRTEVRSILRKYAEERLKWAGAEKAQSGLSAKELLNQLWEQASVAGARHPGDVDVFLGSVSEVIRLQAERVMLRERSHIPGMFWAALLVITILAHAAMGYHGGVSGTDRSPVMVMVAIAFSIVIALIVDLDNPGGGFINVSQQAMIDVRDFMKGGS